MVHYSILFTVFGQRKKKTNVGLRLNITIKLEKKKKEVEKRLLKQKD